MFGGKERKTNECVRKEEKTLREEEENKGLGVKQVRLKYKKSRGKK